MKSKQLLRIIIPGALLILMIVGMIVYVNYDRTITKSEVDLYFLNDDGTGIISEQHTIRYRDDKEKVRRTLESLKKGSSNQKRGRVIPKGTEIQRIVFSDEDRVVVDFSDKFLTGDPAHDVLDTYAVIKTLCSTGCVSEVEVTVNGRLIHDRDGKEIEFISASDINLGNEEYISEMKELTLYFADRSGKELVKENRKIRITDLQPTAQYIINELIKGTKNSSMQSLLSKQTKLISVDVDNDICYLNFHSDFIGNNSGSDIHEQLVVYSIVNSLTETMDISRVQFYMNGKRVDKFGSVDIKDYISRNTDIIKE